MASTRLSRQPRARRQHRLGAYGMTAALTLVGGGFVAERCDPPPPSDPAPAAAPAPAPEPAPAPAPSGSAMATEVVSLVNARRAEAGLPALAVHDALVASATAHSTDMASRGKMSHTGSDGSDPGTRIARAGYAASLWAENVAAGQTSAAAVTDSWMNSAAHRSILLNGSLVHVGVAAVAAADGTLYWTMDLGAPA